LSEAVDFVEQLLEEVVESYEATYDEDLRTEFRCGLFCLMQSSPDCSLRWSDVAKYFAEKAGGSIADVSFDVAIQTIFEFAPVTGNRIVYVAHALVAQALSYGSSFANTTVQTLQKLVQAYLNDPDTDHTILCDDCGISGTWLYTNQTADFASPVWSYGGEKNSNAVAPYSGYNDASYTLNFAERAIVSVKFGVTRGGSQTDRKVRVGIDSADYYTNQTSGSGYAELEVVLPSPVLASSLNFNGVKFDDLSLVTQTVIHWIEITWEV